MTPTTAPVKIDARPAEAAAPWPLVLIDGEASSGADLAALDLATSPRVGDVFVLEVGEASADVLGGDRVQILQHDGSWTAITAQIDAVAARAADEAAAGRPPVVLIVSSVTDLWSGLKAWVGERHRRSAAGMAAAERDPDGDHRAGSSLWDDAQGRHRRLMTRLLTFSGIVVLVARQTAAGAPDCHRDVPYDATLWLRLSRTAPPTVVGVRTPTIRIVAGVDDPWEIHRPGLTGLLDHLLFDELAFDPRRARPRNVVWTRGGDLGPDEVPAARRSTRPPAGWTEPRRRPTDPAPATPPMSAADLATAIAGATTAAEVGALFRSADPVTRAANVRSHLTAEQINRLGLSQVEGPIALGALTFAARQHLVAQETA